MTPPEPAWEFRSEEVVDDLVETCLAQRGLRGAAREAFLKPSLDQLHDPYQLPDLAVAVEKLLWAVKFRQPLTIFGDYDCDGVTGTVLLHDLFRRAGARVDWQVPDRDDGYGLSTVAVARAAERGSEVIVTVDNGISAVEAVAAANARGIDVIITDHHQQERELPAALAVVNPNRRDCDYPFGGLAGVGVAYKLASALAPQLLGATRGDAFLREALDLVAIGSVADMVPLVDENRALVTHGLAAVASSSRIGLQALLQSAGVGETPDATDIGFRLGPRLNAAGRMARAGLAAELLMCDDRSRAGRLAEELDRLNGQRRALTEQNTALAEHELATQGDREGNFLLVAHREFHAGLVGLVAGRLAQAWYRPTLVLRVAGDSATGSARSVDGYDITAALGRQSELLTRYGGHPMAAGCTLPRANLAALREALQADAAERLTPEMRRPRLTIDAIVDPETLTLETWQALQRLAPFGQGNPAPVLACRDARVAYVRTMGRDGRHLQLSFSGGGPRAVGWSLGHHAATVRAGDRLDLAFTLVRNRYRGVESLQLELQALRAAR